MSEPATRTGNVSLSRRRFVWAGVLIVAVVGVVVWRWSDHRPLTADEQRLVGRWRWIDTGVPTAITFEYEVRPDRTFRYVPVDPPGDPSEGTWEMANGRSTFTLDPPGNRSVMDWVKRRFQSGVQVAECEAAWDGPDKVTFTQVNPPPGDTPGVEVWVRIRDGSP